MRKASLARATARILVVEDEATTLEFIRAVLDEDAYAVSAAPTLADGRAALAAEKPDVVLLDLGLPDGDGLELLAEAGRRGLDGPTFLVVSANGAALDRALDLGARDFVQKPFRSRELRARVRAALRDRRTLARLELTRARAGRAADRASRLQEMSAVLSGALDTAAVATTVLAAARSVLGASAGSVALLTEDGSRLRLLAMVGFPDEARLSDQPIGAELPGPDAARSGRAIFVGDPVRVLARYPLLADRREALGPIGVAAAPLIANNRTIGAISLRFPAGPIPRSTRSFMRSLAAIGGQALDRARMYEAARWRETRFRTLIEHSHDLTAVLSPDATLLYLSPSIERILGYTPLEILGRCGYEFVHPDDRARIEAYVTGLAAGPGANETAIFRVRGKDGGWRVLETVGTNATHVPEVGGVVFNCRDVTRREEWLRQLRFQAHLLDNVGEAAVATDVEHTILYWNRHAERLFGWNAWETLGRRFGDLFKPTAPPEKLVEIRARLARGESWSEEAVLDRRDGSTFPAEVTRSPVQDDDGRVVGYVALSVDLAERKRAEEDRARLAQTLALLAERDRIAMELHDGAIQALYGTTLQLGATLRTLPDDAPARPALAAAVGELNNVIHDVRSYVHGLASNGTQTGLRAGLQALVARYRDEPVRVELTMPGREGMVERALGPDRVSHVLQIAGEATTNAVRHAEASTIVVQCRWTRRRFVLEVHDDGKGLPEGASDRGSGLRNMVARAGIIGGTLKLGSRPADGTIVHLEVPLNGKPA